MSDPVSKEKALEADDQVIRNALFYIRINPRNKAYNDLKTLYVRAYRKGFEAGKIEGKKEGRVKIKTVYETVDPNEDWGDFKG